MKKWIYILSAVIWITQINVVNASNKVAVVNLTSIFQQSAHKTEIIKKLEHEFKDRAVELEMMEHDLQVKMKTLQQNGNSMKKNERNELEKSLIAQREIFSNKAKIFQQENHLRQTEERDKILDAIYKVVKNIAKQENYNIVIDTNAVIYYDAHIKDITNSVIQQVG